MENENNGIKLTGPVKAVQFVDKNDKEEINKAAGPIKAVEFVEKPKDPEKKKYLVLYYVTDGDEEIKSFEEVTGRTATYEFIKNMVHAMDIHTSKVLVETVTLEEAISVYEFMVHISQFFNDGFDIEEYNYGDDTDSYNV
jgi:hypothetical protein